MRFFLIGILMTWALPAGADPPRARARKACTARLHPVFDPGHTVTIEVHGFGVDGVFPPIEVYGRDRDGSELAEGIRLLGSLPDGTFEPSAPNQVLGTRYYGTDPPGYYTPTDIAEVETLVGIPRYALIVAKHAEHVMARSGAVGVNFVCHSMGGLVTRYLIERDVGCLLSRGKIARWVTVAGVITGADLARLFQDPIDAAAAYGLHVEDIQHMKPAWVAENVAICDGSVREGNNPAWQGLLIHHVLADDFTLNEIYSLPLLELINLERLANDAVLYTSEQHFHDQAPEARFLARSGEFLKASVTHHSADHFLIRENPGVHAVTVAALLGSRRVRVVLEEVTLLSDHEKDHLLDFEEWGFPPAEIVVETRVTWPEVGGPLGNPVLVEERGLGGRVIPVTLLLEGETRTLDHVLYESPLLDELTTIKLELTFLEADWYVTEGIFENLNPFGPAASFVGAATLALPITSQSLDLALPGIEARLRVEIHELY